MELSDCDRVFRTMWKRPHSRTLLLLLFVVGILGLIVFLNPELTTPPGMEPGPNSYLPIAFFVGWLILLAIYPVWWLVTENYGKVGVSDAGLLVSVEGSEDHLVGWDAIEGLIWSTLGVTEPVPGSYIMTVVTRDDRAVEIGYAHRRPPHADMVALREAIVEKCRLRETDVRPTAWFEDGHLQIAGMEHQRRWMRSSEAP